MSPLDYEEYYSLLRQIEVAYQAKRKPIEDAVDVEVKLVTEEYRTQLREIDDLLGKKLAKLKPEDKLYKSMSNEFRAKCEQVKHDYLAKREYIDSRYQRRLRPIESDYWKKRKELDTYFKEQYIDLCPLCNSPFMYLSSAPCVKCCSNSQCPNHMKTD